MSQTLPASFLAQKEQRITMMNYSKFYYVETVAELQSFTRAAEKLYISQPALTKSISKLEDELGVKLFDRSVHPLQLTYAGERYLIGMRNVVAMHNQLKRELEDIANMRKGRLIVGIPNLRGPRWLPYILPKFLQDCPDIDIRIVEGTTASLEQDLLRERINIAVITSLPQMTVNLENEEICQEQLMLLANSRHPMFQGINLTQAHKNRHALHYLAPERLEGQPYISYDESLGLYRSTVQLFEHFSIHPQKVVTLSNSSSARDLAASGLGFVLLPSSSAHSSKLAKQDVMFCSITDPPTCRTLIISHKQGVELSPAARRFVDITKSIAHTEPSLRPTTLPLLHDLGD